jgi:Protein of unknown function (DUF1592)/Protein of unknown function (DUF1588)/Protein of unknown function (DUF1587)/Protein of unknown function (DUF1595)/Protein of unknown function (DUF1585)/Ca-dependent carbohydrate-binding module xylan-binding
MRGRLLLYGWCVAAMACGSDTEPSDPGRVTIHRLNNAEYNNTVRDLLGTSLRPADDFPSDDRGYGFDNVADSLNLSPLQLELYERAAEALIEDVFRTAVPSTRQRAELETVGGTAGAALGEGWHYYSNGSSTISIEVKVAGTYRLAARAGEDHAGSDYARMAFTLPGVTIAPFTVTAPRSMPAVYQADVTLPVGTHMLKVAFTNDFYDTTTSSDRNLWVDYVEAVGPNGATVSDTSKRDRILICDPATGEACLRDILRAFVRRAWRRTPTDDELARLVLLAGTATAEGDDAVAGLKLALRGALVSPHFLFRVELDEAAGARAPHPLSGFELASRLSYFLWSSMPDDGLLAAAEEGRLGTAAEVRAQAARMLADPRAEALVGNFAGQWLFTRALGDHVPDYATYPMYDAQLAASMRAETERFFRAFLFEDVPLDQLLTADFTYANDRLAAHYGLPKPGTTELVRVSLAGTPRRGLLTQGSILTVTSHPRRTSPVKRGKWLLDQILCEPPPPPPPGVEGLPDEMGPITGSVRERFEQHRRNEICAACHASIDPLGFALESFDGIGAWRTTDGGYAVDASGQLPDGRTFDGAAQLGELLADDPRVYRCMVEKLYTYALGRRPDTRDARVHIDELADELSASGHQLRELVMSVVTHPSFRYRRGEP